MQSAVAGNGKTENAEKYSDNTVKNNAVIYGDAKGFSGNRKIENDGTKIIQAQKGKQDFSKNAVVKKDWKQTVRDGGTADRAKIYGDEQHILKDINIGEEAKSSISPDAVIYGQIQNLMVNDKEKLLVRSGAVLKSTTMINRSGELYLDAGSELNHTTAEEVILKGKDTKLYSVTSESDGKRSLIKKLSGKGSVIFSFNGSDPYYSQLYVNNLSGNLHFKFNTTIAHDRGDYLFIQNGEGNHTVSVSDSGVEITDPVSKKRDLITDQSGGAHFILTDFSGAEINAIDGGTYMYSFKNREDDNGKTWFLSADYVNQPKPFIPNQAVSSSNSLLTTPSTDAVLSTAVSPGAIFNNELQTVRAGRGLLNKSRIDTTMGGGSNGRGFLDKSRTDTALWTSAIMSKENVATGHTNFKLEQTGVMLGADKLNELMHGDLYIGGFGSYDQARVAHARGGLSNLNTYSIGAYATYFDDHGWYLDGVLKYNHYQNDLQAISTNGSAIQGNYGQWAVGTSFETGYRFKASQDSWMQPYIKMTGLQVEGKKINLSNGMIGDINPFTSLRSEVGLFAGHEFIVGTGIPLTAYITAAFLRENMNNNYTIINKENQFITDLSGNAGELGIGLNSFINDKLTLHTEAHYLKGHKIKQSLQGILGIRYSF
ncbi:autotransporter outer membrane beta-barrel domain-containing protein [Bartonella sp. CB175]|uniref:autotransporter outer membrane beta-barrel domain-containing protein n=1 Tax=Bartonella sp. CB175 TaxID=3112256 RepID=UPI00300E49DE